MRVQMSSQITKILEGKTDLIFIFYYLRALVKALPLSFTVKGQGERGIRSDSTGGFRARFQSPYT